MRRVAFWSLTVAVGWILAFLVNLSARDSDLYWTVEMSRMKRAVAGTTTAAHRILFVGGSHTHYSISAAQIESELGCPSVNLGLHAGLGLGAILEDAAGVVRAGDLVVITPEYGTLMETGPSWLTAGFGAATGRLGIGGRGVAERAHLAFAAGTTTITSFGKTLWTLATGEGGRTDPHANARGDTIVFYYDIKPLPAQDLRGDVAPGMLVRLREYRDSLAARGAVVVFNLPTLLVRAGDDVSRETAARMARQLSSVAPVITHGEGFNLASDPRLFSDSGYHLTRESRAVHSHRLSIYLGSVIDSLGWTCRPTRQ